MPLILIFALLIPLSVLGSTDGPLDCTSGFGRIILDAQLRTLGKGSSLDKQKELFYFFPDLESLVSHLATSEGPLPFCYEMALKLLQKGKQPEIVMFRDERVKGKRTYVEPFRMYRENVEFETDYHIIVLADEIAYDPTLSESPMPLLQYLDTSFNRPVPFSTLITTKQLEETLLNEDHKHRDN